MCFVNKMDRLGADFYRVLDTIKDRLDANVAVLQLPIGAEGNYKGVINLINMKALVWLDVEPGAKWEINAIPAVMQEEAADYRQIGNAAERERGGQYGEITVVGDT